EFVVAWFYYEKDDYKAAVGRLKGIIDKYPGSQDEPKVLYYLTDSYIRLKDWNSAKDTLAMLYQGHPDNQYAKKAKEKLAGEIPAK
ncbi:MAG: tetratricopeptide repeat protein, partial [Nitrospirota bacterium]